MEKIQKTSQHTLSFIKTVIVILPLITTLMWIFIDSSLVKQLMNTGILNKTLHFHAGSVDLSAVTWTPLSKCASVLAGWIGLLPIVMGLFLLKGVFERYTQGDIFNTQNAKNYNTIAWLFFLNALITKPLSESLSVLAATLTNPPGHRYITISFGTPNIESLFYGVLVVVISWAMLEASKLHDEQKLVI